VSEVVRFSLFPEALADYPGERRVISENVVRVITDEDDVWRDFEYKVRKNVNKARASGVTVVLDRNADRLEDFLRIFHGTMDRRNAGEGYYFSREYFQRIQAELGAHVAWFHALVGETVVSTELVLVSADHIYSFLGGTDAEWFHVRPNDLLKLEIMNWARRAGKTAFVLGGGYVPGDGIYRFKLSFAPGGSVPFSIGCRVFNAGVYDAMTRGRRAFEASKARDWQPRPDYFPAWRG
jgi:lipid II:glycine glycyltransferase (peptidoglycan interpeptide bridge formation enzyme)